MLTNNYIRLTALSAILLTAACPSPTSTCVSGSTMACLCVGGATGVQSCRSDGTFAACECVTAGVDASVPSIDAFVDLTVDAFVDPTVDAFVVPGVDAARSSSCPAPLAECGGRCVDTSTDEAHCGGCGPATACGSGAFCVGGSCRDVSGACPPPFVVCGGDCIDPSASIEHCGATGACTGATDGESCDVACRDGRCVYEDCLHARERGGTTDGLYLVDPDGSGPLLPRDVYCDQTTVGGGWMLAYRIRNDVPDISDPWWGMVALGSGSEFPTSPTNLPAGMHFEGPTREVREAHFANLAFITESRATLLSSTGAVVLDALRSLESISEGRGMPTTCRASDGRNVEVIAALPALGFSTLPSEAIECIEISSGGDTIRIRERAGAGFGYIAGDGSLSASATYRNSTTLVWMRRYPL